MQNNYIINVKGYQNVDGENSQTEVTTSCSYELKRSGRYIIYKEYGSDNINDKCSTIIKFDNDKTVTVSRVGANESRLILEEGKRHHCHYNTPMGQLMVGIFTSEVKSTLNDNGGKLSVSYTLDFNSNLASENKIIIDVRKQNN